MSAGSSDRPLRVLVVEDSVDEAFIFQSVLEERGHTVRTVQDGQSALDLWDAGSFDAVVTDLNLPGMDGVELTRRLKMPERGALVVAVTAYQQGEYIDAVRRAGVDHVLLKPLDLKDLTVRLEESTSEGPARAPSSLTVLAIATRPGDAAFGCGGTLVRHRKLTDEVVVLVTSDRPHGDRAKACARRATETLDVRIRFAGAGDLPDSVSPEGVEAIVQDVDPDVVYLPGGADYDVDRRAMHARAVAAASDARRVLGYLTPSSTLDFVPDTLRIVTPQMPAKLEAIEEFAELGDPALTPRFVKAAARWWGRSSGFAEVEPFEQIRS